MKNLYIIGAGGFGREVYSWISGTKDSDKPWAFKGFIDDDLDALKVFEYDIKVVSSLVDFNVKPNDIFICAIGNPKTKQICVDIIKSKGAIDFLNVIHPSSIVAKNVKLGEGVILCPLTIINSDAVLGNFVTVNNHSNVGHNSVVGDWSQISGYCDITGGVVIGEYVFFGSSSTILPNLKIGNNSIIGAGSVVVRNVDSNSSVFGNPAKKINF